jgi:hypothetical protein
MHASPEGALTLAGLESRSGMAELEALEGNVAFPGGVVRAGCENPVFKGSVDLNGLY